MNRLVVLIAALALCVNAFASDPRPPEKISGFRADYLAQVDDLEKKLVGLAEATPADKFSWRPAPDVRSISEVYMHVAFGNYFIPAAMGMKPPAGVDRELEKKVTEKAKVIETLKQSFQSARDAARNNPDLDKSVKLFGQDSSVRATLFLMASHMHEHLGQSIAYARVNGIAPPWSRTGD